MTTDTELTPESTPDPHRGVGGCYVIGEDGIRHPAPTEQPEPEQPAAPADEE